MPLKKDFAGLRGYMEVSDEAKERKLYEEIAVIMHLLAVVYPPGCREVIEIPLMRFNLNNKIDIKL